MPTAPERMPAAPRPQYASYVPSRNKVFKTHASVGHVLNALHLRTERAFPDGKHAFGEDITLYVLRGDEYVTWMNIPAGTRPSDYPELFRS